MTTNLNEMTKAERKKMYNDAKAARDLAMSEWQDEHRRAAREHRAPDLKFTIAHDEACVNMDRVNAFLYPPVPGSPETLAPRNNAANMYNDRRD